MSSRRGRFQLGWKRGALRISLIYLIVGCTWILVSDRLVGQLFSDPEDITRWSIYKGWFYVLATSIMLYYLIRANTKAVERSQYALSKSEERYRHMFNGINDVVLVHGFDENGMPGRFLEVNDAAIKHFGYTREELLKMSSHDIDAPEGWALEPKMAEKVRTEKHAMWEGVQVNKAGEKIPVEISNHLFELDGKPVVIVTVRNITERKEAEHRRMELEANQREFYRRTILAATEGKLIITDQAEIERISGLEIASWKIEAGEDLSRIREAIARIVEHAGMDEIRVYDFILAVGETTTNAYKHGVGGTASLHRHGDTFVFIVSDQGPGIEALTLPEVALKRGYSTAGTLGMGYKAILAISDHAYLSTGPGGTTVGIEMTIYPVSKPLETALLPDTWY